MADGGSLHFESVTPILSVLDLPQTLAWYERAFGFERAWTWGDPMELASLCRGRIEVNLGQRGVVGPAGPSQIYLRVAPIETFWDLAQSSGATIHVAIADRPYGLRDFSILDASGNRLDFGEPSEGPARRRLAMADAACSVRTPAADTMKVFVPAKDFALSKRFYRALGFVQNWEGGALAEIELGATRLLLQDFYHPAWAGNFMIHIEVPDADGWARHAQAVLDADDFAPARIEGPRNESWGYRVTYVHDPSGVLLRFSQPLARPGT
jgi:catechol 2,3-dioxygenase-like lactoylglutathione lyase family enzyme